MQFVEKKKNKRSTKKKKCRKSKSNSKLRMEASTGQTVCFIAVIIISLGHLEQRKSFGQKSLSDIGRTWETENEEKNKELMSLLNKKGKRRAQRKRVFGQQREKKTKKTKNNVKCILYWRVNDKITDLWVIRWTASIQRIRHDHRKTNQSFRFYKADCIFFRELEEKNKVDVERKENEE